MATINLVIRDNGSGLTRYSCLAEALRRNSCMVTPQRNMLAPHADTGVMALATALYFEGALKRTDAHALGLSDAELRRLAKRGREWIIQDRNTFVWRIGDALPATLH